MKTFTRNNGAYLNVSVEHPEVMDHSVTIDGESLSVSQLNTYTLRHRKTNMKQTLKVNKELEK
jgi:hypothetical protein